MDYFKKYYIIFSEGGKIIPHKVYEVADIYKDNIVLCTMNGHIVCIKYGIIYDTFDPSNRNVEFVWVVK